MSALWRSTGKPLDAECAEQPAAPAGALLVCPDPELSPIRAFAQEEGEGIWRVLVVGLEREVVAGRVQREPGDDVGADRTPEVLIPDQAEHGRCAVVLRLREPVPAVVADEEVVFSGDGGDAVEQDECLPPLVQFHLIGHLCSRGHYS